MNAKILKAFSPYAEKRARLAAKLKEMVWHPSSVRRDAAITGGSRLVPAPAENTARLIADGAKVVHAAAQEWRTGACDIKHVATDKSGSNGARAVTLCYNLLIPYSDGAARRMAAVPVKVREIGGRLGIVDEAATADRARKAVAGQAVVEPKPAMKRQAQFENAPEAGKRVDQALKEYEAVRAKIAKVKDAVDEAVKQASLKAEQGVMAQQGVTGEELATWEADEAEKAVLYGKALKDRLDAVEAQVVKSAGGQLAHLQVSKRIVPRYEQVFSFLRSMISKVSNWADMLQARYQWVSVTYTPVITSDPKLLKPKLKTTEKNLSELAEWKKNRELAEQRPTWQRDKYPPPTTSPSGRAIEEKFETPVRLGQLTETADLAEDFKDAASEAELVLNMLAADEAYLQSLVADIEAEADLPQPVTDRTAASRLPFDSSGTRGAARPDLWQFDSAGHVDLPAFRRVCAARKDKREALLADGWNAAEITAYLGAEPAAPKE